MDNLDLLFQAINKDEIEDNIKPKGRSINKVKITKKLMNIYGKNFFTNKGETLSYKKLNYRITEYKLFKDITFDVQDLKIDKLDLINVLLEHNINFQYKNKNLRILPK